MIKTTQFIVSISLAFSMAPWLVSAETATDLPQRKEAVQEEKQQKRDALKQEVEERRDAVKQDFQQRANALKQELQQRKDALKQEFEKKRQEFEAKRQALQRDLKDKREKFQEEMKMRKEELKKKLGEKRAENIEKFFNQMTEKIKAAIERLKKSADRIDEHLKKAEARGKDVGELRIKLLAAREKISDAEKALEDAKAKYTEVVKEPDFRISFQKVREVVHALKEKVKIAHRALVDVINSVKGLSRKEDEQKERMVEITSAGFQPSALKIKVGMTVRFMNKDSQLHWPASGIHPTHELCAGFDALKGLAQDEQYSFTFKEVKTCPMHDHLNPSLTGSIIVEQ